MAKENTIQQVKLLIENYLKENQYDLYHLEYVKEGKDHVLRLFIDQAPGAKDSFISTDDCEKVSKYISPLLDEKEIIKDAYYLEVSSPGMDRPLKTTKHYEMYVGKKIDLVLYEPVNGEKQLMAILVDGNEDQIRIEKNQEEIIIARKKIAKATLTIEE